MLRLSPSEHKVGRSQQPQTTAIKSKVPSRLALSTISSNLLSVVSRNRLRHDVVSCPRNAFFETFVEERQAFVVEAHEVQVRGVQVGDVARFIEGREAEFIGRADGLAAGSGEPDAEAAGGCHALSGKHLMTTPVMSSCCGPSPAKSRATRYRAARICEAGCSRTC